MTRGTRPASPLRVQLWTYNYDPEPTGIGPVSTTLARELRARGHDVAVVAAHPHYPEPVWGRRVAPYREIRNGVRVLRLPLRIGRATAGERMRQEASYALALTAALPFLGRPEVVVAASPSFPALLPTLLGAEARRIPWVLWLHDILPEGAAATGLLEEGSVLRASRLLERTAYRSAARIVVLSRAFATNLAEKGVAPAKVELIYDPATRVPSATPSPPTGTAPPRLLSMGNIGFSQGLAPLVAAFEADERMAQLGARLVITGNGVAAEEVRREVRSARVEMLGLVSDAALEDELRRANVALVTQHHRGAEFNIPSKLMNFMAYGLPVLAAVNPASEVAHIVSSSEGGWVVDSSRPATLPDAVAALATDPHDVTRRGAAALAHAREHFEVERFGELFEDVLLGVVGQREQG